MNVEKEIESYAMQFLGKTVNSLSKEEYRVLKKITQHTTVSQDMTNIIDVNASFGDKFADKIAKIIGSWNFIIGFFIMLIVWAVGNSYILPHFYISFDSYPYTFLNVILSMIAAFQAPVILMSQNRQAKKDNMIAQHDYEIDLHAEIEIMRIHRKLDRIANQLKILESK